MRLKPANSLTPSRGRLQCLIVSQLLYSLRKHFPHDFTVSICSFKSSSIQHDVQEVNLSLESQFRVTRTRKRRSYRGLWKCYQEDFEKVVIPLQKCPNQVKNNISQVFPRAVQPLKVTKMVECPFKLWIKSKKRS